MPTERLSMQEDQPEQKLLLGRSHRQIAESLEDQRGRRGGDHAAGAGREGLADSAAVEALAPSALEARLYPSTAAPERPLPDFAWIHRERRRVGVTLELLHLEYLAAHPDGYGYSAFCGHYRRWLAQQRSSMRQVHTAGEKTFVDYAGQRPSQLVDPATGEVVAVELFVAVLGASNYTYAEATCTQRSVDFIQSHTRTVEYFGGVSAVTVPDQLRTGVTIRAGMSRGSSGRMRTGRGTTGRSSSPRGRRSPATRRRSKSPSRSPSAGFSRGCGTRPSSPWPR